MIGGGLWLRSEHDNLHFDIEWDIHIWTPENDEAIGYTHNLDLLIIFNTYCVFVTYFSQLDPYIWSMCG